MVVHHYMVIYHPMDCCTPGSSVLHYLPEFAQIHVHLVGDTIYLSIYLYIYIYIYIL